MDNQIKNDTTLPPHQLADSPVRRLTGSGPKLKRYGVSIICALKKLFYFEINILVGKYTSFSVFLFTRFFRPHAIIYRKLFFLFLCVKFLLIDPFSNIPTQAQTNTSNDFSLIQLQSHPVSFSTSALPSTISINSLPVSYSISMSASFIKLSSLPVSFNTSILPTTITLSSKPVSYTLSQTADLLKISSLPVSYSLNSFSGNLIKTSSASVSYKTFNGTPILQTISPNLLPISQSGSSISVSLNGENFAKEAVASIGTLKINTEYKSSKELIATIPANYLNKENSFEVFVTNPPPEGNVSKGIFVRVVDPVPIAKINAAPNIGVAPQIVTFDGRDTEDLLAKYFGQALNYSWNFGDDENETANENLNTSTNPVATHKYSKPGNYPVTLTVKNAYGKLSTITKNIEVRDKDEAPIIDASYKTTETNDSLEVAFDASMTFDPENDPISFKWELGKNESAVGQDGEPANEEFSRSIFTYRLTKKGIFVPKITVTDSLGVASVKFLDPISYLGPNIPPTPIANISPATGYLALKDGTTPPSLFVKLSAKDSFDSDGSITKYIWTILDIRNQISEIREGDEITYEFNKAGTYKVKLAATDDRNKTIEKEESITVLKPVPIASADVDKASGEAPLSIQFTSNGSRDFDGSLVNVKWNFGDGTPDSIEPNPIHIYNKPGAYLATLTVTSSDGRIKKTNTKTILVNENTGPVGIISVLEGVGLGITNEAMIKLTASNSFDPQLNQMLSYSWSWIAQELDKDKNLIDISEVINKQMREVTSTDQTELSYTFIAPGQYTPVLTVKTEDGRTSKTNGETITILPGQNPVAIGKITSEDLNGTDSLTVKFDASGSYDPKTDGNISSYLWEFGEGETSSEISPEHTYNTKGTYNAKLTVQDSRGLKSTALTQTIKVTSSDEQIQTRVNALPEDKEIKEKSLSLRDPSPTAQAEAFSFSFSKDEEKPIDSTPPQITLSIENPTLKAGESVSFKAHISDDTSIESVGYKIIDENNNSLIEVIEPAPGNKDIDSFMAQVDYLKNIPISINAKEGKYKLLLYAKDKTGNWLGKDAIAGCHPEQSEGSHNVNGSFVANAPQDDTSCQIVSSDIIISGRTDGTGIVAIEGEELNEKANADVIEELDTILQNQSDEDKMNLIRLTAADKNETAMGQDSVSASGRISLARKYIKNRESILREKTTSIPITTGKPSSLGAPSTTSITNTVTVQPSIVMASTNGKPYIDLSFAGSIASSNVKNYSAVNVSVTSTVPSQTNTQTIQTHLNISCAAGADCSPYVEKLNEINAPRVTYVPIDSNGNKLDEEKSFLIDPGDLIPNQSDEKYTPVINSLNTKELQEGSGAVNLIVNGTMFNPSSTVLWNSSELKTEYIDNTAISALVPAHYTSSAKEVKIKVKKIAAKDTKIFYSDSTDFKVKPNLNKSLAFNTETDTELEIEGSHPALNRIGGNVYISNNTTVFKEAGEIIIPFAVSRNSSLNFEVTGTLISPDGEPEIDFYHNNQLTYTLTKTLRERDYTTITKNTRWNVTLSNLDEGNHAIKLSLPDIHGETIFVLDSVKFSFTSNVKPQITGIYPSSVNPLDKSDRTIEISGKEFGKNPKVKYLDNTLSSSLTNSGNIKVSLPENISYDMNQNYLTINVQNSETNKYSDNAKVYLRAPLNISQNDVVYTFNPDGPNASLHINITSGTNLSLADKVVIVACNKTGKPIAQGTFGATTNNSSVFDTSFILPYDLEAGVYHVFATLIRNNNNGIKDDYSDIPTKQLIDDVLLTKITDENTLAQRFKDIPISHHKSFSIGTNASVKNSISGIYFASNGNFVQENQEISVNVNFSGNITDKSMIIIKTNYGDGTELIGENTKHAYKLSSQEKSRYFEIKSKIINSDGAAFESRPELIFVYKDLAPLAIAKIDTENFDYQGDAPFKSAFTDKSYDPNEDVSASGRDGEGANENTKALDSTIPEQNIWKLFKYKDGLTNQIINTEDLSVTENQVLSGGKYFATGNILNPGTYYANLTVFDMAGNADSTQSETIQVTLPSQKLLVHASFENPSNKAFSFDNDGKLKIQFRSIVQTRGNTSPKNIIYNWSFGDGQTSSDINPIYTYKRNQTNKDNIDFHPELTVTAIWNNGKSETWSSKAGTISIIDKPEFVALDLIPDTQIGNVPLTVNFMIGENSFAKNATVTSYSFDFGDGSEPVAGQTAEGASSEAALTQLKQKTFTHTYTTKGDFTPKLIVKIKENTNEHPFNSPIVSTNGILISSIEVTDPPDNYFTNNPIQTFKIKSQYANPFADGNRLTIHLLDEENNEAVTELDPGSSSQTLSLGEGTNTYWFELIDASGAVQKSLSRKVTLDTIQPSINNLSASVNPENNSEIIITGNLIEDDLQKVELQLEENTPIILSSDEIVLVQEETNEHKFTKTITNISETYHNIIIKAYDLAGNVSEESLLINKQKNVFSVFRTENQINNSFKSPSIISNKAEHIHNLSEITKDVISGEPFDLQLFTCFNDDGGLGLSGKEHNMVETFFAIDSHKLTISKNNSEPVDITANLNNISEQAVNKCFNIQSFGIQYKKPDCNYDSPTDLSHCFDACTRLDGHICNSEIISTTPVNKYQKDVTLFDAFSSDSALLNQWDVGSYELKFTINLSQDGLNLYGTSLGKDPNNPLTSQTFTYKINVLRKPDIKTEIAQASRKLKFDEENEIRFKVIASDNIQFTQERKPTLDVQNKKWTGLIEPASPTIEIISETIDPNDPKKYTFELKTNLKPKSLKKIDLELPLIFPPDYFNPTGINHPVKITFGKIEGSFAAEITSPPDGTFITEKTNVSSTVTKPQNLQDGLNLFNNCKKSVINYGIKAYGNENIIPLASKPLEVNPLKIASKGKDLIEQIDFKDLVNFNLKNITGFKDTFLSGSIFGPIELYGEYSTACTEKNLEYNSTPKTLALFDYLRIIKAKCKHPNNSSFTTCEITTSNNTFSDNYEVIISPNPNDCKPTITGENKLTRIYKFSCLPPDISTFEVKLKRDQKFLENIQEKINLTHSIAGINITTNENILFANRKNVSVKNVASEENDFTFEIGDGEDEIKTTQAGNMVSVHDLKEILITVGLLDELQRGLGYTKEVKNAWKLFIYLTKLCDVNNLRLQTVDPNQTFMLCADFNVIHDANGNLINLPNPDDLPEPVVENLNDIPVWKQVFDGFTQSAASNIKDLINPTTIGIISTVVALTATGIPTILAASIPAAILAIATYSVIGGLNLLTVKSIIDELNITYNDKTNAWKISYAIGRLQPDLTLIKSVTGLVKNVKISAKADKILALDNGAYKESAEFIVNQQRTINKLDITEKTRNIHRDRLDTYADSAYDTLLTSDQTRRTQINDLHIELNNDTNMKADLENNVIYKDYPKDLNNTLEDTGVIKEKIYKPTIEYGAKAKAQGIENQFIFRNKFDNDIGSNFNLEDLQKQGFLLGDVIPAEQAPTKLYRIIEDRTPLTMLTGDKSGPVFIFNDEGLSKEQILSELRNNKDAYLKKIGANPIRFSGNLKLVEIDNSSKNLTLYKPTNKDARFDPYFRYNPNNEPYGRTLNLNDGTTNAVKEYLIKDVDVSIEVNNGLINLENI